MGVNTVSDLYFAMSLTAKIRWKAHIKKKKEHNIKFWQYKWLAERHFSLSLYNKNLDFYTIYIFKLTGILHGIQLLGHMKVMQTYQNKMLNAMVNAETLTFQPAKKR